MSFATAYGTKKRCKKNYAFGGGAEADDAEALLTPGADPMGGDPLGIQDKAKGMMGFAKGGEIEHKALDMVGKIMDRHYSKGGMVANETPPIADSMPNEFDELVLTGGLEDSSGPGNEIGNEELEDEDQDVVSKILSSRKKKDRMPRPA
jgi:hypothetical protein